MNWKVLSDTLYASQCLSLPAHLPGSPEGGISNSPLRSVEYRLHAHSAAGGHRHEVAVCPPAGAATAQPVQGLSAGVSCALSLSRSHLWNLALLGLARGGAGISHVTVPVYLWLLLCLWVTLPCGRVYIMGSASSWRSLLLSLSLFHPNLFFRWGHTGDRLLPTPCLLPGHHLPLFIPRLPRGPATCRFQVEAGAALPSSWDPHICVAQVGLCQGSLYTCFALLSAPVGQHTPSWARVFPGSGDQLSS